MQKIIKAEILNKFYSIFQIGIEVEGSFLFNRDELQDRMAHCEVVDDGSVNSVNDGGYEHEIRSEIISSTTKEKIFLDGLENISDMYNEDKIFAYRNKSAGTHIHFDFNDRFKSGGATSYSLLAFDSLEFERYFFREYFKRFNKSKFSDRLSNSYCRPYLRDVRNDNRLNSALVNVEDSKANRDRYYWLNTQCLSGGKGIELRIFPYLQTVDGVQEVINFTKEVLYKYWEKPKVQRRAKLIENYYANVASRTLNLRKLNEYEKILLHALNITDRNPLKHSSDSIEFLMDLFAKKPSAFEMQNVVF